jgi:probable F420-dependent oxidoreductase
MVMALGELGYYTLAGHSDSPRDLIDEARTAEALGLGAGFVSERFNVKDACTLSGALGAVTEDLGIATAATNHNTRHPLITATFAMTMHRMTGGRFCLGLGRGFDALFQVMGVPTVTMKQLEDVMGIYRSLWRGEPVMGHDGPAGAYPYLGLMGEFDDSIPILMVAIGEKTLEFSGKVADAVVLHTFFSDEALERAVAAVRRGAEKAGKDPASVRIWSVLATVGDHIDEDLRLKKLEGRLATYLQGYGPALLAANGWDPAVLDRFRQAEIVTGIGGAIDAIATPDQLRQIGELLPDEWLAASATGTPEQCAQRVLDQYAAGADAVILHGATPTELAPVVEAYKAVRPADKINSPANPGWIK